MDANGVILWDDLSAFQKIYESSSHTPRTEFYEITSTFRMDSQKQTKPTKKRKSPFDFINEECDYLERILSEFNENLTVTDNKGVIDEDNNKIAREAVIREPCCSAHQSKDLSSLGYRGLKDADDFEFYENEPKMYENSSDDCITINNKYIIPQKSRFINDDINICKQLIYRDELFDCIVIDPPWPNKAVKRKQSYATETYDLISSIPAPQLLSEEGIVYLWVTNSPTVRKWASDLLEEWNLTLISEVFWVKITKSSSPVCAFHRTHKLPYEKVMVSCRNGAENKFKLLARRVILSVPHAYPSRKPPIAQILQSDVPWTHGLELFGRSLLPGFLTVGNQCLKFQDLYFYNKRN